MSRHVAHIVQRMAPGGLEVLALELASQLPGRHTVISLEGATEVLVEAWPRLIAVRGLLIGMNKTNGLDPGLLLRLSRLLRQIGADTVVTHHAGPLVYGGPASRFAGIDRIVHVEHDVWHYQSAQRRWLMRTIALLTRPTIVGVAEKLRRPLSEVFPDRPVEIIANGVDLARFVSDRDGARSRLGVDASTRVIGAAGRLEQVKGHDVLLDAFAALPSDTTLMIVGDGSQREALKTQAEKLGVAPRVRFLGHRDDVEALYAAFDVFCQPSRNEGLPLAVLEAQACGAPVVATAVGDLESGVCPVSGKLVPAGSAGALAAALKAALERKGIPSPRQFVAERFNWRDTLMAYQRILGV